MVCFLDLSTFSFSYVHTIGFSPHEQVPLERALQDFRLEGSTHFPTLETLASAPLPLSLQNQMDVLCSLSNDPFNLYPTSDGTISKASSRIGYMRYLSYQVPRNWDDSAPSMLPASFRNRFIYFRNNNEEVQCRKLLQHIFAEGNPSTDECQQYQSQQPTQEDFLPPPLMTTNFRKVTQPVVKITAELLENQRVPYAPSMSLLQVRAYDNFRTNLVESGDILWRLHTVDEEYFIMNDYRDGGELVPNSFVEVIHHINDGHTTCTCSVYNVISGIASNERPGQDILPVGILCMHCRFFDEEIYPRLHALNADEHATTDDRMPSLIRKLQDSRAFLNNPVVPLSKGPGTCKYSVRPSTGSACAIVNVSSTGIMATCSKGTCKAAQRHKRSVKGLLKVEVASSLCEHLSTMHANREVWAPVQPPQDTNEEDEDEDDEIPGINTQDIEIPMDQVIMMLNYC